MRILAGEEIEAETDFGRAQDVARCFECRKSRNQSQYRTQENAMKQTVLSIAGLAIATFVVPAGAQDADVPEQTEVKSERVVKQEAGQQVEEIRIDGRLQSVRVKPRVGPEYIIEDRAGDGSLASPQGGEMDSRFNIRTWKIGEW
jgi:hypothetical protein